MHIFHLLYHQSQFYFDMKYMSTTHLLKREMYNFTMAYNKILDNTEWIIVEKY